MWLCFCPNKFEFLWNVSDNCCFNRVEVLMGSYFNKYQTKRGKAFTVHFVLRHVCSSFKWTVFEYTVCGLSCNVLFCICVESAVTLLCVISSMIRAHYCVLFESQCHTVITKNAFYAPGWALDKWIESFSLVHNWRRQRFWNLYYNCATGICEWNQ